MAREYPPYPLVSCHGLVRLGDQILLVQRARPPFAGFWGLPGGGVELGETVEEALIREVKEETGIRIQITGNLGYANAIERDEANRVRFHYLILYFVAEAAGGILAPGSDARAADWVWIEQARQRQLTDSVERCLKWAGL